MSVVTPTEHALTRLAQRGMSIADVDFIIEVGSETKDGYLITKRDVRQLEGELKRFMDRIRRLEGKVTFVRDGDLITAFHATEHQQKRLLRNAT